MNRLFLTVLAVAAVGGCATTAGYEKMLNSWIGSDELSLVRKWGAPTRTFAAQNRRFLVFESVRNKTQSETLPYLDTVGKGSKATLFVVPGSPATTTSYTCTTTFELQSTRVVGSSFSGNDCRAKA